MRILIMAFLSLIPFTAAAQERASFRDWSGRCSAALCTVQTEAEGRARLLLEPLGPTRRALYLALSTGSVRPGSWIAIAVDGVPVARFGPVDGWRPVGGAEDKTYEFAPSIVNADLLNRLRLGSKATVVYARDNGEAGVATFSLMGLTAALAWLDDA